jgi:protoheme IX farnesyltransferase
MWTPPHFWALALWTSGDYERAGIPMLPNVAGAEATRRQILIYTAILAPLATLPWLCSYAGPLYGLTAVFLGAEFVRRAVLLWRRGEADNQCAAKSLFGYSIVYLFTLFAARLVEAVSVGLIGG